MVPAAVSVAGVDVTLERRSIESASGMSDPLVSVVMPTYNNASYIEAAIASLVSQTYYNWELVLVDDCSTDGTAEIVLRLAALEGRISSFRSEINLGVAGARNLGIREAAGKYITFLDSDDEREPSSLEKQVRFLEANPGVIVLGTGCQWCDEEMIRLNDRLYPTVDREIRRRFLRYSPFCVASMMLRASELEDPVFDVDLWPADDIDLPMRLGLKGQLANLPEPLYRIRTHRRSVTQSSMRLMERQTFVVRRKAVREYGYRATVVDVGWNATQWVTMYLMPASWRLRLFNRIRAGN